jgi:hypothetical protein
MRLRELQRMLLGLYAVEIGEDVCDYLVTDPAWLAAGSGREHRRDAAEQLLIEEAGDEISLALYLDAAALARVEALPPGAELDPAQREVFFLVLEGVSHFNYVAWNATRDKRVTLLELEMQAEIDKFVTACALPGAVTRTEREAVFAHLFAAPVFDPALGAIESSRYQFANHLAGRYCRSLSSRYPAHASGGMLRELRAFYRWPQPAKVSHIHAAVFA